APGPHLGNRRDRVAAPAYPRHAIHPTVQRLFRPRAGRHRPREARRMSEQTFPPADDVFDEVVDDRKSWVKESVAPLVSFAVLVLLWELAADYFKIPTWLLPSPSTIGGAFVEWRGELWGHTLTTLYETLVGFALSIALAVPLAVAVVYSPFL